jgi:cytochrome P450
LFTPTRLKALNDSLVGTADTLIDEFIEDGKVNLVAQYGGPFATLVISDLLGIPEKGRRRFREILGDGGPPAEVGGSEIDLTHNPLVKVGKTLFRYIALRRMLDRAPMRWVKRLPVRQGKDDILTQLALAKFPDGSTPSLVDCTGVAAFLFGAGQDTTNRLLANCFRVIATRPDLQQELRDDPKRIPKFVEELLRFDGSVKSGGRMCQKTTEVGGVEIKAGTTILLSHMAANRDPRKFENPGEFNMDRPKAAEHVAFGRGAHTCIGAPLARKEVSVSIERLLARLGNIRLSESHHGRESELRFEYEPTYILRALRSLHLEFDKI